MRARAAPRALPASALRREGYGLVVVEAAARGHAERGGRGADNAATELIEEGENGFVAARPRPRILAEAIVRTVEGGLRAARVDRRVVRGQRGRLSIESSLARVEAA